jgi:leader peptidase (prepilin peptidase)/N-methyltransferase
MPLGIGVNGRSHCPRCQTQLSMRDNFPVFGWLALGGRCRTCKLPISPRYPIVEACVGGSLTVLSIAELYRVALPHHAVPHGGPLWAPRIEGAVLWTLLYHAVAVAFCWSFGLIRVDGKRLPVRLVTLGLLAAMVPMLVFPQLMIVTWQLVRPPGWTADGLYLDAVMRVVTALVAAGVFARSLARSLCPAADPKLNPLGGDTYRLLDLVAIIALPTIVVGWQASPCLVLLASVLAVASRPILPRGCDALGRFAIAMPIAMTLQIACWRRLNDSAWWTGEGSSTSMLLIASALVLCAPLWLNDRGRQPDGPAANGGDNDPGPERGLEGASAEDED